MASIALATTMNANAQMSDKGGGGQGKQKKCNNLKIMAVVTGINLKGSDGVLKLFATATLQGQTVTKTIAINATDPTEDDGVGVPLFFKKAFEPCPAIGTQYTGMVNGVTFASTLTSLTRPNLVQVDLSIAPQAAK